MYNRTAALGRGGPDSRCTKSTETPYCIFVGHRFLVDCTNQPPKACRVSTPPMCSEHNGPLGNHSTVLSWSWDITTFKGYKLVFFSIPLFSMKIMISVNMIPARRYTYSIPYITVPVLEYWPSLASRMIPSNRSKSCSPSSSVLASAGDLTRPPRA